MAAEHRRLGLRLTVAPHGAVGHDAAVAQHRKGRVEGVERLAARRQRVERRGVEREAGAAVLHQDAGRRQHAARAEFPVDRLDVRHRKPAGVGGAHPDGVAATGGGRPFRRLAPIDLGRLAVEEAGIEIGLERDRDAVRIGDEAVADPERALGRLDYSVDVIEALGLPDPQAGEQRQDDERSEPLGRRRRVVKRAGINRDAQRFRHHGAGAFEVGSRDRAADSIEVGGDLATDVAAIEIVEASLGKMIERRRKGGLPEQCAGVGRLAVDQEGGGETRRVLELSELVDGQPVLAAHYRIAVAGMADGRFEECRQRQAAALGLGGFQRQGPSRDRTRHREGRERPALRDDVVAVLAIERHGGIGAGAARPHQGAHPSGALAHEPEAVAADVVHVRIDRGDRGRHGNHGFERIAALGKDRAAGLGRGAMGRGDHAAAVARGMEVHQLAAASPRLRSSASTVGSRPRNAL